jgi:ribonuclease P protein component
MFPQKYRLLKKKDFQAVLKKGRFINNKFLYVKLIKNNKDNSCFGIIISKKICKKAVVRNKIKRQIREIIRKNIPVIINQEQFDLIIIPKKEIIEKSFTQIEEDINQMFKKVKQLTINNKQPTISNK